MIQAVAHADMLVVARQSRGWTQSDLAQAMSRHAGSTVSQGYVSKAEVGRLEVTGDRLTWYAAALRYPTAVLCVDPQIHGVGVGLVHHRTRASLGAPALRRIHTALTLARMQTRASASTAGIERDHRFHHIEVDDFNTASNAAVIIRHEWGLAPGAAPQMVHLIEDAGGLVLVRDLDARELDAVTQWIDGDPPLFLINAHAPADRFRFSLAHELGHVILHREPGVTATQERQADEFASEFLLPADTIRTELKQGRLTLPRLLELKHRWGVSMAALLRRASTLGVVSDWQYRNLMVELSAVGYRKQEPSDLVPETPRLVRGIVAELHDSQGHHIDQLAAQLGLLPDEFAHLYLPDIDFTHASPAEITR